MLKIPIIEELKYLLKSNQILITEASKAPYLKGFRIGKGEAIAVVIPDTLFELWKVLEVCVKHDVIMILQASNTGVTGGSTPDSNNYDRDVLVISTRTLKGLQLIQEANQVIAFPGTTLTELENALKPYGREPHSVIGSSCIGASVIGGVCNNSGGSLIHRGPAYTEKSLFAQIDGNGTLQLVNHLGITLGTTPEEIFQNLENKNYLTGQDEAWEGRIWAENYRENLRDTMSSTPTRYNGNPEYLHESAGCSGKLAVFAVRLPTFEAAKESITYIIGSNDESQLIHLRKFLLEHLSELPSQAEYIHKNAFKFTQRYAKHMYKAIDILGAEKIPNLFAFKSRIDNFFKHIPILPNNTVDRFIQLFNRITPSWVEPRLQKFHQKFQHLLMIKIDMEQNDELQNLLSKFFSGNTEHFFQCNKLEEKNAFLIRFAVGGCVIYYCESKKIDPNERLVSFDVAFRRNDAQWLIKLPDKLKDQIIMESCCGHFFCFVSHQDYLLKEGVDAHLFKKEVLAYLEERGAKYPAEHNVGHLYHASPTYEKHLKKLDPTNAFNPGIGKTSKSKYWR
ncbi:D-lactate dehydrogenase [Acinetobacter baumannii]|uniref:D-lactate dehydrogenase n=1 Tax=Acinetobacter baumannii TaxID=470 RepID=UPI000F73F60B|nr:D-lactate dehydrogenase [Acinetobacter baumannii]RSQ66201.1 D-lactate dehydrogenase [Acinetobacter baumannii]